MSTQFDWRSRAVSSHDAVALVKSGMNVFVHGACATPTPLLRALCERTDLADVRLFHLHLEGEIPFVEPQFAGRYRSVAFFAGGRVRDAIKEGRADFMPVFLSDIPGLFHGGLVKLDAAIVQLSPPDKHGMCTLGTSVDAANAAVENAKIIIAEINDRMPRTHGRSTVPFSKITAFVHTDRPLAEREPAQLTEVEEKIGEAIAAFIDDGACLQLGIGGIPDAVLSRMGDKNDLGIHTEMFSDRVVDLAKRGVVTNKKKNVHAGRTVTSFVAGTKKVFDFVDDNPLVEFHPCDRTNSPRLIALNDQVVAINSALAVDLSGQVCADSLGHDIYSGIGGQMDFIRAAAISKDGKPIIALPSTASKGRVSRITAELTPGSGVVTTRGHIHWVVTEFGAVNLHGLTLRDRAGALISIAHPDFRSDLKEKLRAIRRYVI